MKVIFLGTPEFAVEPLKAILESNHEVVAVVTQPDRQNARGNKVIFSPIKTLASECGIPVLQYNKISAEGVSELTELNADIMVTCAYGQILSQKVLDICRHGVINIHASLLPKYRGSSPVQWAIINGDKVLGVTIMQTALKVDSGSVLLQKKVLLPNENSAEALAVLSKIGAEGIVEALDRIEAGSAVFVPQQESEATHCRMLSKEDGLIDFSKTASEIVNFVRGMTPWPSAYTVCKYGLLKLIKVEASEENFNGEAGEILISDPKKGLIIKCGEGAVRVMVLQGENAKAMSAEAFLSGKPMETGSKLGAK